LDEEQDREEEEIEEEETLRIFAEQHRSRVNINQAQAKVMCFPYIFRKERILKIRVHLKHNEFRF
jgi:hypothetical protein